MLIAGRIGDRGTNSAPHTAAIMATREVQKQYKVENQSLRITGYMHNIKISVKPNQINKAAKRHTGGSLTTGTIGRVAIGSSSQPSRHSKWRQGWSPLNKVTLPCAIVAFITGNKIDNRCGN